MSSQSSINTRADFPDDRGRDHRAENAYPNAMAPGMGANQQNSPTYTLGMFHSSERAFSHWSDNTVYGQTPESAYPYEDTGLQGPPMQTEDEGLLPGSGLFSRPSYNPPAVPSIPSGTAEQPRSRDMLAHQRPAAGRRQSNVNARTSSRHLGSSSGESMLPRPISGLPIRAPEQSSYQDTGINPNMSLDVFPRPISSHPQQNTGHLNHGNDGTNTILSATIQDLSRLTVQNPEELATIRGDTSRITYSLRNFPQPVVSGFEARRKDARWFFQPGRVFMMPCAAANGTNLAGIHNKSERPMISGDGIQFISKTQYMLSVRQRDGYCICCPIQTHGGKGLSRKNIALSEARAHAIIHSAQSPPVRFEGEPDFVKESIPVIMAPHQTLHTASRVHFGKLIAVEWNVIVKNVGELDKRALARAKVYYQEELLK